MCNKRWTKSSKQANKHTNKQANERTNEQTSKQINERTNNKTKTFAIARTQLESIPNRSALELVEDFCVMNTANKVFSSRNNHHNVRWQDKTKQKKKRRNDLGRDGNWMGQDLLFVILYPSLTAASKCLLVQCLNWRGLIGNVQKHPPNIKKKLRCRLRSFVISTLTSLRTQLKNKKQNKNKINEPVGKFTCNVIYWYAVINRDKCAGGSKPFQIIRI